MRDMTFDKADLDFLSSVALFKDVPEQDLKNILSIATVERFEPGEIVLIEGEATNDLMILRDGNVEVYVSRGDQKVPICQLGAKSYFGEMSVFDDYPRSANVRALNEATVLRIDRDSFRELLHSNPAALFQMCTVFSHRLRNTNSALAKH